MNLYGWTAGPLGPILLTSDGPSLTGLYFQGQKYEPRTGPGAGPGARRDDDHAVFRETAGQLARYFAGRERCFQVRLSFSGSPFQNEVWRALIEIPYGTTTTYGELAERLGRPAAARAVGAAVGRNPLSIIIPCHRVLGRNGSLTGYAGGLDRKKALLELEARGLGRTVQPT
ncbi:MAG: methylated-DNA--[protein]-cysteine S-methyltransferase [Pseudomonadota bacterium]